MMTDDGTEKNHKAVSTGITSGPHFKLNVRIVLERKFTSEERN